MVGEDNIAKAKVHPQGQWKSVPKPRAQIKLPVARKENIEASPHPLGQRESVPKPRAQIKLPAAREEKNEASPHPEGR